MKRNCRKRQELKNYSIGEVGLNINGDLSRDEIIERAKLAERAEVRIVWIGEFEGFDDPFNVAETISEVTKLIIGFGVLSVSKRECQEILEALDILRRKYGERYILGLGAGSFDDPKRAFRLLKRCLNESCDVPVVIGASSPGTLRLSSKADGVLFNSVNPEFIKWMANFVDGDIFRAAYGPSLLLPSEFDEDLIIAGLIVFLGSKKLISEFGFQKIADELSNVDLMELVDIRRSGKSIERCSEIEKVMKYREFILQNFTISGDVKGIAGRIKLLLSTCDHVILSDPFFRDLNSMRNLGHLINMVRT